MASNAETVRDNAAVPVAEHYDNVRALTLRLTATLMAEDTVVQSMPDVSPTKWHLAHTSWFFERFVLEASRENYRCYNDSFDYLFNSYYYTAGQMHRRSERGLLSRPTLVEILEYRKYVDDAMAALLDAHADEPAIAKLVTLGLNHEQQHQELLLTDIKHVFSCHPDRPAVNPDLTRPPAGKPRELNFATVDGGIVQIGASGESFNFDNETPRHDALLHPHKIADRLVSNSEFLEFVRDGGYSQPALWLSDGWSLINEQGWQRPLYWDQGLETEFTLAGTRAIDPHAPVSHVSFYEADAFARWAGARLPSEFEWEHSAAADSLDGNFLDAGFWHPAAATGRSRQFFGDTWEWTASAYAPYPGFKALDGSLGEYNGKFMCNQMSVRGGSCLSSHDHLRSSYRSFFYPDARWQVLGLRLAKDNLS
jgi:ergothioneine biosynthesis protein EgtB